MPQPRLHRPSAPPRPRPWRRWRRDERGDVPGWVMITLMTIVVGTAVMGVFQQWAPDFVRETLNSVK